MTADQVPVDNLIVLRRILENAEALLIDFDGPVCSVFAGMPARFVAQQLRSVLVGGWQTDLPADVQKTDDPFAIFSYAATLGKTESRYVEAALRAHEVEAVATAEPTPGSHHLMRIWHGTGRKLAIVSNNSQLAIEAYLNRYDLWTFIDTVSARKSPVRDFLKPNPYLVTQAVATFGSTPSTCVLLGDSDSDIIAARSAGTLSIGYANKDGKRELLKQTGATAVVSSIEAVCAAIH